MAEPYPCSGQTYSVTGTLSPTGGTSSTNGSSYISLTASSPSPGSNGSCFAASQVTLTGYIENNGCDLVGPTNATEASSLGSYSTTFSKTADLPTGETTNFQGFGTGSYATVGQWRQVLTTTVSLNGRQVSEQSGGTVTDSCYFSGSAAPQASISGGWWNVGYYFANNWDDDYVGYSTGSVAYYRTNFRTPCSTNVPQAMYIAVSGTGGSTHYYTSGSVGEGIPDYVTATSTRNGNTQTVTWP